MSATFKRVKAGFYVSEDGARAIIRVEHERPNRGVYYLWESAYRDERGGWVIDNDAYEPTLREAKAEMARLETARP